MDLKEPKAMDNSELLENTLQLYARACDINCSRELHERAMALKAELSNRLGGISGGEDGGIKTKVKLEIYETDNHKNNQSEPAMPKIAELKFIQFNLNDEVKFKWTEEGKRQYIQYYEKLGIKPIYPKTDEKGFYRLQMWEFMHVFGKEMYNGCEQSIDKNEILIAILHN